jgi:hypothetical protein
LSYRRFRIPARLDGSSPSSGREDFIRGANAPDLLSSLMTRKEEVITAMSKFKSQSIMIMIAAAKNKAAAK